VDKTELEVVLKRFEDSHAKQGIKKTSDILMQIGVGVTTTALIGVFVLMMNMHTQGAVIINKLESFNDRIIINNKDLKEQEKEIRTLSNRVTALENLKR
jgi:hypothetical protein